jgi:hypothetical protein
MFASETIVPMGGKHIVLTPTGYQPFNKSAQFMQALHQLWPFRHLLIILDLISC